ncbi:hypothetical protein PLESTB_001757100 [Pleodorina starrii]|uniref:Uncharacterized protein n=1 Tax=Pleodorina starrii TaxID=330485 RepID=A0A9W6C0B9_9CHLO|nr:hypothetical protein PLESTB_001757100 [Pleodorina starrii]
MPAIPSTSPGRQQPTTPGRGTRGVTADRSATPRTPGRTLQGPARSAVQSPPPQDAGGQRYTPPNLTPASSRTRRPGYGDSPFAAPYAAHPAANAAAGDGASRGGRLLSTLSSVRPAGVSGRFQEPGDDWLSNYERSSMGLLHELERVLGGFSQVAGLVPAPTEAGAPPRQLPTAPESTSSATLTAARAAQRSPASPAGPTGNSAGAAVGQNPAWGAAATPSRRTAWTEGSPSSSPSHRPSAPQALPPAVGLAYTYLRRGASATAGGAAANAATPFALTSPSQASDGNQSGPIHAKRSRQDFSGGAAQRPAVAGAPALMSVAPQPSVASGGSAGQAAPAALTSGTIAELWSVLQACSSTTTRLMADLAAARREVEIANERAEEADGLTRVFQQQLIERQKGVATWQAALAEMEEKEAAARQQLAEVQARCSEQALRAQQAEHVAATVQLRLERLMAQKGGPGAGAGQAEAEQAAGSRRTSSAVGQPNPQLQQQLEHLQADLAAAKTRATRAELELAVARNKALIAQQELSAEEERARRAAAAAAAARMELGRTRSALDMMGRDHDRLQNQLEEVRSKIGDVAQRPRGSSRPDLLAPADQGSPPPPHDTGAARAEGSSRLPSSKSEAGASAAAGRVMHAATPSVANERQPKHRLPHLSARGTAVEGATDDSGTSASASDEGADQSLAGAANTDGDDDDDAAASPRQDGALLATRRRGGGSLLLVPPGEMPAETSASVRYGHRMVMRRQSRSQDLGSVLESPRGGGGGGGERGGWASPVDSMGRKRSPRAMSGSHDGVVRRLDLDVADCGSTAEDDGLDDADGGGGAAAAPPRTGSGRRSGRNRDGYSSSREGAGAGASASRSGSGGALLGSGMVTEEMLPLSRTPSSGTRRRLSSLRTSQASSSREAPLPTRNLPHHPPSPSEGAAAAAAAAAAQKAGPAATAPGREPQVAAPSAAAASRPASGSSRAGVQPEPQSPQQQSSRRDSLSVSLADLRRQMAAAAGAVSAAPTRQRTTSLGPASQAQAGHASPAASPSAAVASRSPLPQPPRRQSPAPAQPPRPHLPTHHSQPTPASARASPAATTPSSAAAGGGSLRQVRSALPELLPPPPLEESCSPPERPLHAADVGAASRSPLAPAPSSAPQPSLRAVAATAAAMAQGPALTAAAHGGGGAALPPSVAYRPKTAVAAVPSRRGARADISPPQGFHTSHLNDLYESTQSLRFSVAPPPEAAAAPLARGLLEPAQQPRWPPPGPLRWQGQAAAAGPPPPAAAAALAAAAASGRQGGVAAGAAADEPPGGSHLAFTPRSRMLSPSQLDSHLVSPSVTNSMAAVASIDGHLPAAVFGGAARPWQQPQQEQRRQLAPSPLRGASAAAATLGFVPAGPAGHLPAAAAVRAQSVGAPPAAASPSGSVVAAAAGGLRAVGTAAGPGPRTPGVAAAAGAPGVEASPQPRRPWWCRWLPPRRRRAEARGGGTGADSPQHQPASGSATAADSPDRRSPAGGSVSRARSGCSSEPRAVLSPLASANEPANRPVGRASPASAVDGPAASAGKHRAAGAADGGASAGTSPRGRGSSGGGGGGGGGHVLRSALLHLGMWSGGMAVGVLLVLGVAGVVEGTLGLGAGAGPLPAAAAAAGGGDLCGCPAPDPRKQRAGK